MAARRLLAATALLLPLLLLPLALFLRSRDGALRAAFPEPPRRVLELVVSSPHWDGVKVEFEEGFRRWLRARDGSDVAVTWLDHGGGANTLRWIQERFRRSPDGIGVDLLFGGGTDPYEALKADGLLLPHEPHAAILHGVARELAGFRIVDPDGTWFGTALTGFGVMWNREVLRRVPELRGLEIKDFADLADPRLRGWVGAADPRGSASYHTFYEILLQAHGYAAGLAQARLIGANVAGYAKFAAEVPKDCALGQVACAATIDHYARAQIQKGGAAIGFVLPEGTALVNADAAAILKGAPHEAAARLFIDFLLSEEAGLLWMLRPGEAGGPRRHSLARAAVRPDLYARTAGRSDVNQNPFAMARTFRYDDAKATARWTVLNDLLGAILVEAEVELREAVRAYHALADEAARERVALVLFENPIDEDEMLELARSGWDADSERRERARIRWTEAARQNYRRALALARAALAGGGGRR